MTRAQGETSVQVRDPREDAPVAPFPSLPCFDVMGIGVSREDVCATRGIYMLQLWKRCMGCRERKADVWFR